MDINRKKCKSFFYTNSTEMSDFGVCQKSETSQHHNCTLASSVMCKYYSPGEDKEWGPRHKEEKEFFLMID